MTPYKATIPIGIIVLSTKDGKSNKVKINKFYVSKIWRSTGYEERAIMEMLKFCFAKIEKCSKVIVSFYSKNVYFIQMLMGIGFKFNKQNKDNGDPKQRLTLWIFKADFLFLIEHNLEKEVIKTRFYYKY